MKKLFYGCIIGLGALNITFAQEQASEPKPQRKPSAMATQYVDVNIVPVGPVPLARFGMSKDKGGAAGQNGANPTEGADNTDASQGAAAGGRVKGFIALDRDPREFPPRALYLKRGDNYMVIPCSQNSIAAPVRIPLSDSEMVFYKRVKSSEGRWRYEEFASHKWKPGQKRLLFTLTKELKNKHWTDAKLRAYDVSPSKVDGKSAVFVNAGQEREVGLITDGKARRIKPHARYMVDAPVKGKAHKFRLGLLVEGEKLHAPQNMSLPYRGEGQSLILTFPCSKRESFRGIKTVRGRITPGQYRKPGIIKPRRG